MECNKNENMGLFLDEIIKMKNLLKRINKCNFWYDDNGIILEESKELKIFADNNIIFKMNTPIIQAKSFEKSFILR